MQRMLFGRSDRSSAASRLGGWRAPGFAIVALTALVACSQLGCSPRGFVWPHVDANGWNTYSNDVIGYTLRVPAVCEVEEADDGRDVLFRFLGAPIIAIRFVDESEGSERGLWVGHEPISETELSGRSGFRYRYDHYDGPFGMQTVSYVVPHRDRLIGLELRTGAPRPTTTQQAILDSFAFHG